jgi:hypothetical protein
MTILNNDSSNHDTVLPTRILRQWFLRWSWFLPLWYFYHDFSSHHISDNDNLKEWFLRWSWFLPLWSYNHDFSSHHISNNDNLHKRMIPPIIGSSHCDLSIMIFPVIIYLTKIPLSWFPPTRFLEQSNHFVSHRGLFNHDFYSHDILKQWYPQSRFLHWESLFSALCENCDAARYWCRVWIQLLYANNRNTLRSIRPLSAGRGLNWTDFGKTVGVNSLKQNLSIDTIFNSLLFWLDNTFNIRLICT